MLVRHARELAKGTEALRWWRRRVETFEDAVDNFITVQDGWIETYPDGAKLPGDWVAAYRKLGDAIDKTPPEPSEATSEDPKR